jgi:hypothetical protein
MEYNSVSTSLAHFQDTLAALGGVTAAYPGAGAGSDCEQANSGSGLDWLFA